MFAQKKKGDLFKNSKLDNGGKVQDEDMSVSLPNDRSFEIFLKISQ